MVETPLTGIGRQTNSIMLIGYKKYTLNIKEQMVKSKTNGNDIPHEHQ